MRSMGKGMDGARRPMAETTPLSFTTDLGLVDMCSRTISRERTREDKVATKPG